MIKTTIEARIIKQKIGPQWLLVVFFVIFFYFDDGDDFDTALRVSSKKELEELCINELASADYESCFLSAES